MAGAARLGLPEFCESRIVLRARAVGVTLAKYYRFTSGTNKLKLDVFADSIIKGLSVTVML